MCTNWHIFVSQRPSGTGAMVITEPEILQNILSMMENKDNDVREATPRAIVVLSKHGTGKVIFV
jgi:hypothetical protein